MTKRRLIAVSYRHDKKRKQDVVEMVEDCVVERRGQFLDAARLVDGEVLGRIVGEVA